MSTKGINNSYTTYLFIRYLNCVSDLTPSSFDRLNLQHCKIGGAVSRKAIYDAGYIAYTDQICMDRLCTVHTYVMFRRSSVVSLVNLHTE